MYSPVLRFSQKYDINFIEYIRYSMPYSEEEYAYMRDKGTIIYSPDSNAPPLSYIDKETGKHEGLIIDYMSSISIESAMSVVCQPMPWGEIFEQLRQKKVDTSYIGQRRGKKISCLRSRFIA